MDSFFPRLNIYWTDCDCTLGSREFNKSSKKKAATAQQQDAPLCSMTMNSRLSTFGRSLPLGTIIPAFFFASAAVCFCDPAQAPFLLFLTLGLGASYLDPIIAHFTEPAARGMTLAIADSLATFADETNKAQTDRLLKAIADSLVRVLQSGDLRLALNDAIIRTLTDGDLQAATITTLQQALVLASEDEGFVETALDVTKRAFVGALQNRDFVEELMESMVGAIVQAAQNEQLHQAIMSVVTKAVSEALRDERFMSEIRSAVKESLQDGEIYRAGAKGMISAALPSFGRQRASSG